MSSIYYRKDAHKSIEGLLYALFVYAYLLDTSTFGLLLRCLVQDQLLSVKSKDTTLRIAVYAIFATSLLAFLRHLHAPSKYAIIIDFIGNVAPPSRTKLVILDAIIFGLQILQALVVSMLLKSANSGTRTSPRDRQRRATATATPTSPSAGNALTSAISGSATRAQTQPSVSPSGNAALATGRSSGTRVGPAPSPPEGGSSSTLFEYTPTHHALDPLDPGAPSLTTGYYEDNEETRFSQENNGSEQRPSAEHRSRRNQRRATNDDVSPDTGSGSESSNSDEDEDVLRDDFEELREQEIFVFQLHFKDIVAYLFSNEEPLSLPRLSERTAATTESDRVQNLPV